MRGFHQRFSAIKESTIQCLEQCCMTVMTVVFLLTSALGECKGTLEKKLEDLSKSQDHLELFTQLNFYWNYLSFGLLHGLIDELFAKRNEFTEVQKEMEEYKQDMQKFKKNTKLVLFCQVDYSMLAINQPCDLPPGFSKMVTEHKWPQTVTLQDVEEFRKRFLLTLRLPECAMVVNRIQEGCFKITWFAVLPPSLVQQQENIIQVFVDYKVILVEINGECVYQQLPQLPPPVSFPLLQ